MNTVLGCLLCSMSFHILVQWVLCLGAFISAPVKSKVCIILIKEIVYPKIKIIYSLYVIYTWPTCWFCCSILQSIFFWVLQKNKSQKGWKKMWGIWCNNVNDEETKTTNLSPCMHWTVILLLFICLFVDRCFARQSLMQRKHSHITVLRSKIKHLVDLLALGGA